MRRVYATCDYWTLLPIVLDHMEQPEKAGAACSGSEMMHFSLACCGPYASWASSADLDRFKCRLAAIPGDQRLGRDACSPGATRGPLGGRWQGGLGCWEYGFM